MLQTYTGNFIELESEGSYPRDPWYWDNVSFGYNSTNSAHQTIHLAFTTPSFIGDFKEISFCIQGQFGLTGVRFRYALCTSNANRDTYKNSGGRVVSDPYQLVSGITSLTEKGTGYTTGVDKFILTLSTVQLQPNTKYYLFFWDTEDSIYLGKNAEFIIRRLESINHLPYCTYTLTYNDISVSIDNGSGFGQYYCYIDTESITSTYSCEILGQRSFEATRTGTGAFDSLKLLSDYSTINNACWGDSHVDSNTVANYLYQLKFKTPENVGDISKLVIGIKTYVCHYDGDGYTVMQYALSSSDEYYERYLEYSNGYLLDPSVITHGKFKENTSSGGISNIVINNIMLSPNTIYYLNINSDDIVYYYDGPITSISPASEHTVAAIGSDSIVYEYELYKPYIDNGTTWEPL